MARNNQRLINYHTTGLTYPEAVEVQNGEIVVRNNETRPEILIKKNETAFATFIDSAATETMISNASTALTETINAVSAAAKSYVESSIATLDGDLQGQIDSINEAIGLGEDASGETLVSRIETLETATGTLNTSIEGLAESASTLDGKIDGVEAKFANYALSSDTHNAIQAAIAAAAADAEDKDDAAFVSAVTYVNNEIDELSGVTSGAIESLKEEINNKIGTAYVYKGTVNTKAELPESGKTEGFVYNVTNAEGTPGDPGYTPAGTNYAWNGTEWDALGGTVDLSAYAKTADVNELKGRVDTAETEIDGLQTGMSEANDNITALSGATGTLNTNLTALDGRVGTLSGRVDTIEAAYVSTGVTNALDERIDALEAISGQAHTHANKTELDKFADGDKSKLDSAVQTVVVSNSGTNMITATKQGTEVTFDFSNMVIDCGSY